MYRLVERTTMLKLKHCLHRLSCDCGGTNLKRAVSWGNKLCVEYLLQKGDNVNDLPTILASVSLRAPAHSCEIVLLLLNAGADPNAAFMHPHTSTFLLHAIIEHCHTCAEELLKHGANVNAYDWMGYTPLMHAVHFDSKCVDLLLKYGADPNRTTPGGTLSPLCLVLGRRIYDEHMVITLLEAGANPLLEHNGGMTALSIATGDAKDLLLTYCSIEHS